MPVLPNEKIFAGPCKPAAHPVKGEKGHYMYITSALAGTARALAL
jgi:hypothetical protein